MQKEKQVWLGTAIKGSDFPLPNYNKVLPSWLSQICPSLQKRTQSQVSHLYLSEDKASCCFTSANSTKKPKAFIEWSIHKKCYLRKLLTQILAGSTARFGSCFPNYTIWLINHISTFVGTHYKDYKKKIFFKSCFEDICFWLWCIKLTLPLRTTKKINLFVVILEQPRQSALDRSRPQREEKYMEVLSLYCLFISGDLILLGMMHEYQTERSSSLQLGVISLARNKNWSFRKLGPLGLKIPGERGCIKVNSQKFGFTSYWTLAPQVLASWNSNISIWETCQILGCACME